MPANFPEFTYLPSFYRLLKRLRGSTPLQVVAARSELDEALLHGIEAGRRPVDEALARHILLKGFALDPLDTQRLILGVRLFDLGLRDNLVRPLIADVILKTVPAKTQRQLRQLYRDYTSGS
jgi:hypothetical protein